MRLYRPATPITLALGDVVHDLTNRALVMGILNRTKDSFFSPAATFELDAFFARAEQLVAEGADLLDVGGVKAGPGDEVSEEQELDRVVPVVGELRKRFDVPISIDTWRASVAEACFAEGACMGNDISGFADPDYLAEAQKVNQIKLYTEAATQLKIAVPNSPMRTAKLIDGVVWDGTDPKKYANGFKIHA